MVLNFAQFYSIQTDASTAGCTVSLIYHNGLSFLLSEDLRRTTSYQILCMFLMVEGTCNLNVRHQAIETGRNRWPFSMLLADPLFSVDLNKKLLVLSQFGDDNILVNKLYLVEFSCLVTLRNPSKLTWVNYIFLFIPVQLSKYSSGFLS